MVKDLIEADKIGEDMGLTKEEDPFYHAIVSSELIKDLYEEDTLIEMAKELATELKENESID